MCKTIIFLSVSHLYHRLESSLLDTRKSKHHSHKCMIRNLNRRFSEKKKKNGPPYAPIICNPRGLILKKMPLMNTLVIAAIQFCILSLNLFRICEQAKLWSSQLNSLVCMDRNYGNHLNSET